MRAPITPPPSNGPLTPDVSVVIAAWKAADFIGPAIRSALSQAGVEIEVIIIDDASPDDTSVYVRETFKNDPRVHVVRLAQNGGPGAARNHGVSLARGRFIAVLDADDTMEPQRLAHLTAIADAEEADIVVDNLKQVDVNDVELDASPALTSSAFHIRREIGLAEYIDRNEMFSDAPCLGYLKPLFRRSTLLDLDIWYDPSLRIAEDYYIVANLLAAGAKMIFDPSEGYRYQIAPGSISHRLTGAHSAAMLHAEQLFAERLEAAAAGETLKAAQARRDRHLRDVDVFTRTVEALKAKRIDRAAGAVLTTPSAFGFTAGQFLRIAREKLEKSVAPSNSSSDLA